jgi:uncharacterized protein
MNQRRPLPPAPSLHGRGSEQGVASPCVNICRMHPLTGYCEGCLRTIDEIACWSGYTDEDKLAVIAKLAARKG